MASHKTDNTKQNVPQNNDQSGDSPSPIDVAEEFGRGYYECLSATPKDIGKYYKDDSVFTVMTEGSADGLQERITGPSAIRERLQSSGLASYRVRLPVFQAQESINGSILILAKGVFVKKTDAARPFVQTFLLAPQHPSGWYVKNDVLVFISEVTSVATSSSGGAVQASSQQNPSNVSSTPATSAQTSTPSTSQTQGSSAPAQAAPAVHDAHRKETSGPAANAALTQQTNAANAASTQQTNAGSQSVASRTGGNAAASNTGAQQSGSNANATQTSANPERQERSFGRPTSTNVQQTGNQNANGRSTGQSSSPHQDNSNQTRRPAGFGRNTKGKEKDESELAPGEKPKNSWASIVAASGTTGQALGDVSPTGLSRSPGAGAKSPGNQVLTIRVMNLPYEASEQQIHDVFKQFGDVTKVKLNRGYCFVEFTTNAAVNSAVAAFDLTLEGRPLKVEEKVTKQVRRGVMADGKRVGMGDQKRPRNAGRGERGGKGQGKKDY